MIVGTLEENVIHILLIMTVTSSIIVAPVLHLHEPKVVHFFPFLRLWCDVIAGGDLQNFVDTKVVVGKVF